MLILGRRPGEKVILTDRNTGEVLCTVLVSDMAHGLVRLGFDAPGTIRVDREEVANRRALEEVNRDIGGSE